VIFFTVCFAVCLIAEYFAESSQSKDHIATDGQSVSQSAMVLSPIWGSWPDISSLKVSILFMWGALYDERRGLPLLGVIVSSVKSIVRMYNYLHVINYSYIQYSRTWPHVAVAQSG
jgi:hypothetical protein